MTTERLHSLATEINDSDTMEILFFDWDCTLQNHADPFPMSYEESKKILKITCDIPPLLWDSGDFV
jgi:hypothetical protein